MRSSLEISIINAARTRHELTANSLEVAAVTNPTLADAQPQRSLTLPDVQPSGLGFPPEHGPLSQTSPSRWFAIEPPRPSNGTSRRILSGEKSQKDVPK
jgi:hypothetical protein